MTEARTVVSDPALGWSYQVVLDKDARRTIVFQTHVSVDTPIEKLNELCDKMGKVADRQIAIYELQESMRAVEDHKRALKGIVIQRELLEQTAAEQYEQSGRRGEWSPSKMTPKEQQQKLALEQSIEKYKEGLERWAKDVERCKGLVNGYAANSSTDSHSSQPGG